MQLWPSGSDWPLASGIDCLVLGSAVHYAAVGSGVEEPLPHKLREEGWLAEDHLRGAHQCAEHEVVEQETGARHQPADQMGPAIRVHWKGTWLDVAYPTNSATADATKAP